MFVSKAEPYNYFFISKSRSLTLYFPVEFVCQPIFKSSRNVDVNDIIFRSTRYRKIVSDIVVPTTTYQVKLDEFSRCESGTGEL